MRPREQILWRVAAAALLGQIRTGSLTVIADDPVREWRFGSGAPAARIEIHGPGFWKALMRGSRGLAESYAEGLWDTPDLVAVIRLAARNAIVIDRVRRYTAPLWTPASASARRCGATAATATAVTSPPTTTSATSCSAACSTRRCPTRARCSSARG